MNRDQIHSLDYTIRKRLGKKANRIWFEAMKELEVLEIIKNHLKCDTKHEWHTPDPHDAYNGTLNFYYNYYRQEMDEETMEQIILWLKENIDKERLEELLKDE